ALRHAAGRHMRVTLLEYPVEIYGRTVECNLYLGRLPHCPRTCLWTATWHRGGTFSLKGWMDVWPRGFKTHTHFIEALKEEIGASFVRLHPRQGPLPVAQKK